MRRAVAVLLALCVDLIGPSAARVSLASVALSQESLVPPELGDVVLADPLTATGPLRAAGCATGRNRTDFISEGFRQKVTGRCSESSTVAGIRTTVNGLSIADGEIATEAQVLEGAERARIILYGRVQENEAIYLAWEPARRRIELRKATATTSVLLAERGGIPPGEPGAWTRLALRFEGDTVWGMVGDRVLSASSGDVQAAGGAAVYVVRPGNVDDDAPLSVVWRNLQVSALAGGDVARAPTYAPSQPPAAAARPPAPAFVPATGTPPGVGPVVYEHSLREPGPIASGTCETGNGRGEVVSEGFLFAMRGRCRNGATAASVSLGLRELRLPDGELKLDFRMTSGHDRLLLALVVRAADGGPGGYDFLLAPGRGYAEIYKSVSPPPGVMLAERTDLSRVIRRDDWNTVAIRAYGSSLWLLLNDQPALSADDGSYADGSVWMTVGRLGNLDDDEETVVLTRNLRVSAIDGAPDDRAPTYGQPSAPPGGSPSAPPGGSPPEPPREPPSIPSVTIGRVW